MGLGLRRIAMATVFGLSAAAPARAQLLIALGAMLTW